MSIISVKNLSKSFPEERGARLSVLRDISFEIETGEFFVLLGPSGAGKSTLLRILSGLDREFEGVVALGKDADPKKTAFVFQQFALLPWLTVHENVELALRSQNLSIEKRKMIVKEELERFGLLKFANHHTHEL